MNKNTIGLLMICDYLLLFLLLPLSSFALNGNGVIAIVTILLGFLFIFKVHLVFMGVITIIPLGKPSYSLKSLLTGFSSIYLIIETVLILLITSSMEFIVSVQFVFSLVLIYFCGVVYYVLVGLYNP